ncbi:MAG: 6-pyruvoyl trahydropterin synthase family protein [Tepidiformaceae bacterium]
MPTRRITVERNRLHFAAAHMATFRGTCEPLHGHNYMVMVDLEGELTADSWVWDFGELKAATKAICDDLDHKFLLQRESRFLTIAEHATEWEVSFPGAGRYIFPKSDVAVLPIDNTTAERLSEYIAGRLTEAIRAAGLSSASRLTIGVEEMPGQTGWYTTELSLL